MDGASSIERSQATIASRNTGASGSPGPEWRDRSLESAYDLCRRMQRRHDPTFYLATLRLPSDVRPAVHALYGFVRSADEIVDGDGLSLDPDERLRRLDQLGAELDAARRGERVTTPAVIALADAGSRHDLPLEQLDAYLESMKRDARPLRIADWEDLRSYMNGSAGTVGTIMAPLLGAPAEQHLSFARLGLAFQLTNFIRDIPEDTGLGRIYLPADELRAAGVGERDLSASSASDGLRRVIAGQVARARELFAEGDAGSNAVSPGIRRGVILARTVYERTLDRVEAVGFDTLSHRASLPPIPLASAVIAGLRGRR
ncbi:MAG: phytoene/squalene synthase family protein [Actinomycetes bacterium]